MDDMVTPNPFLIFEKKRVLITGDTGFKGSWLALWLHQLGAQVTGYALPPERANDHFNLLELDKLIHHVDGDIRDVQSVKRVFSETQPEFLFHLAAQPLVSFSYQDPKYTFDTNVGGSVNILEAARDTSSLRAMIFVTSDKCYKNKEWPWGYRENDELGGKDPYSASKAAAELVFAAYASSFFSARQQFGAASVRAGNVIGGGDWAENRIVPDCIKALQQRRPIILRSPGSTRPWQHVLEPLSGYLTLAAHLYHHPAEYGGSWNFGPANDAVRTVQDLAERMVSDWGSGEVQFDEGSRKFHEANLLKLNCDKADYFLGWRPRWNFDTAIGKTVQWYKHVTDQRPALDITRKQISEYMGEDA